MRFRWLGLCLIALLWQGQALAQQEELTGVVIEEDAKGNLIPLYSVNVYWLGTTIGATTDTNGVFRIPWRPSNKGLVISYIGYEPDTIQVKSTSQVTVVLKNSRTIGDVTVTYREKTSKTSFLEPIHTQVISEKELFKAACCNLSESFETTPSVDVSFSDALTGAREIRMLGLAGKYACLTQESMPAFHGLAGISGMSYVPGTWVEGIQLSKGTGSVVNGYEAMSGQINFELKKPQGKEQLHLNGFVNEDSRVESNINWARKLNDRWSTNFMGHLAHRQKQHDRNEDGFLDHPLTYEGAWTSRWKLEAPSGFRFQVNMTQFYKEDEGGQYETTNPFEYGIFLNRLHGWGKVGYIFPQQAYKSIGLQLSTTQHDQVSRFGSRRYLGNQESYYANLIYQSIIGNSFHKFKTGGSFVYHDINTELGQTQLTINESVGGGFFEYEYCKEDAINVVLGLRSDYHDSYGLFVTPRVHVRVPVAKQTILRSSFGSGRRTPNPYADNLSYLASSRAYSIAGSVSAGQFQPALNSTSVFATALQQEISWNYSLSITHQFTLDYREGEISLDFNRTDFENMVVTDLETPGQVSIYNQNGKSISNSFQVQASWELIRKMDLKASYRWYEIRTGLQGGEVDLPFIAKHRVFVNWAYETRKRWVFDATWNWTSPQRLPNSFRAEERWPTSSPSFSRINAQITKKFGRRLEVYTGGENLLNFRQEEAIIGVDNPFGAGFDASMIWGPVFGRMLYGGFRYRIVQE
jgi:outer membrane receptor for ferrienterochelin and colicin